MDNPNIAARQAKAKALNSNQVETILRHHGVPPRILLALREGPRPQDRIDAIISDIRAFRANGGRLN